MNLLTNNDNPSHVNLHQLILILLLSSSHFPNIFARFNHIIETLCFVLDDGEGKKRISRSDFDYIFSLAY